MQGENETCNKSKRRAEMLRRILNYKKSDWKHIWWLFRRMIWQWCCFDYRGYDEAKFFLKLHLTCDSQPLNKED